MYTAPSLLSLPPISKPRHRESSPCRHPLPHTPPHLLTTAIHTRQVHEHADMHTGPLPPHSTSHFERKARGIIPVPSSSSSHPMPSVLDGNAQQKEQLERGYVFP